MPYIENVLFTLVVCKEVSRDSKLIVPHFRLITPPLFSVRISPLRDPITTGVGPPFKLSLDHPHRTS